MTEGGWQEKGVRRWAYDISTSRVTEGGGRERWSVNGSGLGLGLTLMLGLTLEVNLGQPQG